MLTLQGRRRKTGWLSPGPSARLKIWKEMWERIQGRLMLLWAEEKSPSPPLGGSGVRAKLSVLGFIKGASLRPPGTWVNRKTQRAGTWPRPNGTAAPGVTPWSHWQELRPDKPWVLHGPLSGLRSHPLADLQRPGEGCSQETEGRLVSGWLLELNVQKTGVSGRKWKWKYGLIVWSQ